ncbi:MAG: PTS sugar transporter subunit IIA [candidate division KSB1 bacterium]|nr:PTS sugar transporter subunit IIA [candidate division KSB1 bacterium]
MQNYQPTFKVPFYPYVQIFSILLFSFLIFKVGVAAVESLALIIAVSLLIYLLYGRKKYQSEYALIYLIERIVNRKISSANLETELKEILQKRDNIVTDRFHHLVEDSTFIDLERPMNRKDLFQLMAKQFSGDLGLKPVELLNYLEEREKESSTALTPFLAVPHIIIEGNHVFKMFVMRARKGVRYSDPYDSVKAVFVLIGSKDERQFHLQALSAIAQITWNKNFEKQWLQAKSTQNLKDICLLSQRKRDHLHEKKDVN